VFPVSKSSREFPFPFPRETGTGKAGKKTFPQDTRYCAKKRKRKTNKKKIK
jgi:hypothetical protein